MKKLILISILSAGFVACGPKGNQPNFELIQDMMEQPSVKAQEADSFFPDNIGMRVPPENTVPVGFKSYKIGYDVAMAKADRNPLSASSNDLVTGQRYYETNCAVCHGFGGRGDGPVGLKMPNKPPSIVSDKIKGWADGQIYQVITMGQGTMGPYASHILSEDRWRVVSYIRQLQKTDKE